MKNPWQKKVTLLNMISGFVFEVCTIISGFIVPRLILSYFGSEVNGLVSSLSQFLGYINILEGGLASVMMASLYKPLINHDIDTISSIVVTSKKFYKKVAIIFVVYSLIIGVTYPFFVDTTFDNVYIFLLTIILAATTLIQYLFTFSFKTLLNADKKGYIVSITQSIIIVINIIFAYVSVNIYPSIHILKLISGILFILQPLVFSYFVKKYYSINLKANNDNELIKSRWNGFAINVAAFIHNSTDITLLSIFSSLEMVSVYGVHNSISNGLKQLIRSICSGISPTIGQAYASGKVKTINEKMDLFEYVVFLLVSFCFTLGALLITPFVSLYTKGVNDVEYNQPVFAVLILLSEALYLLKMPHLQLAYSANKFKELTIPAYVEATINIVVSIILMQYLGLIGIAIGTIVAMTFRLIFQVRFTSKIINRSQIVFYTKFLTFLISCLSAYFICNFILPINNLSILSWILYALLYSIIVITFLVLNSLLFYKQEVKYFIHYLKYR